MGVNDSVRVSVDQKFISPNGKLSATVRLTNVYNTRRKITEEILYNRYRHESQLGVSLLLPDKYDIEEYLRLLVEKLTDQNGQKVFLKAGTPRRGFYFVVLNDVRETEGVTENRFQVQQDVRFMENDRDDFKNNTIISIMAPAQFLKIEEEMLTLENMLKLKNFSKWFYVNGKFYEKQRDEFE